MRDAVAVLINLTQHHNNEADLNGFSHLSNYGLNYMTNVALDPVCLMTVSFKPHVPSL